MIASINSILLPVENFIKKYRNVLGILILLSCFLALIYIKTDRGARESGEHALNILWFLLWLPIFARVFQLGVAKAIMPLRKEIGILMGTIAFIHGGLYIVPYWELFVSKSFWISGGKPSYLAFGFFALILTIPLVLTSNNWSMKLLGKKWKMLHRAVYLIVILTVIHVVLLKWYLHFEVGQVLLLILYFIGKGLEWGGIHFGKKTQKSYQKGQKWLCVPCGYIYDPAIGDIDSGIEPGTEFVDIPDSWSCPLCGVKKSDFVPYDESAEEATSIGLIREKKMLNPTTVELVIETEEDHTSDPGQFMSFLWKDGQGTFPRSYSIALQEGKRFTFLIKLSKGGRGAACIENIEIGDIVRIRNIAGRFVLQNSENNKIYIATGTGLAPIFRMIREQGRKFPNTKKALYFSVSTKEDLFYTEQLQAIPNLDLHIHVTREEVAGCSLGRVDIDTIHADTSSEWYLCGNPKMVSEAREKLDKKGYKHIYSEEF